MESSVFLAGIVQVLLAIGIIASLVFYGASYYSARDFRRHARTSTRRADDAPLLPGVTVLKPLKGLDVDLYENLSTFCSQDYAQFQIVFGVADADDPAIRVVRRIQAEHPHVHTDLVIDSHVHGTNNKVSNLINMYRAAAHAVIVIADSDIRVGSDYLQRIVAPLADQRVGLVTCPYRAVNAGGRPTLMESLFINTDFLPMVLVARIVEQPSYAFGATVALRRTTLDEIGGLAALANYLADDYHLGQRVAAQGYRLVLSDLIVDSVIDVGSWQQLWAHQLRWARTYRSCRPGGYFSSILTHGTLWATLNVLYHASPVASLVAAAMVGVRIATAMTIARRYTGTPLSFGDALLVPIKDLFISGVWLLCFLGDTVRWSGHDFRILKDGQMLSVSTHAVADKQRTYPSPTLDSQLSTLDSEILSD